jgi:hypothetical protein
MFVRARFVCTISIGGLPLRLTQTGMWALCTFFLYIKGADTHSFVQSVAWFLNVFPHVAHDPYLTLHTHTYTHVRTHAHTTGCLPKNVPVLLAAESPCRH